jgi:hypothetical protein
MIIWINNKPYLPINREKYLCLNCIRSKKGPEYYEIVRIVNGVVVSFNGWIERKSRPIHEEIAEK